MIIGLVSFHTCPMADLGEKDAGGMNVYLHNLALSLDSMGHTVYIFTRQHHPLESVEVSIGVSSKLVHVNAGPPQNSKDDLIKVVGEFSTNVQKYINTQDIKLEILHSHYWLSGLVGDLLSDSWDVPHVITFHTLAKTKLRALALGKEHFSRSDCEYNLMASSDRIMVLTKKEVQDIQQLYGQFRQKICIVPPGVDLEMFYPGDKGEARDRLNIPRESKIILFVGRIDPIKGIDVLIKALQVVGSLDDIYLYIVGGNQDENDYYKYIETLVKEAGLTEKVVFTGAIPHDSLRTYYNAADVFVLPSHYESLGFVVIEAMACGTPVVASRVGGIPSVVAHGSTGYLIPWRCPDAFANQIEILLKNKDLYRYMANEGKKKASSWNWNSTALKVVELYDEVILDSANPQIV